MNDSKYGRLYPERVVAPLREAAVEILDHYHGVADATRQALKDAVNRLDDDGFPPDEPLFLLRGQDELAPQAVRHYAALRRLHTGTFGQPSTDAVRHIQEFADRMAAWEPRKLPD